MRADEHVPTIRIAGRAVEVERLLLSLHEVAFLLEANRSAVSRLLDSGELANASRLGRRRVAIEELAALIEARTAAGTCSPLAPILLAKIAEGRLDVSRAEASSLTLEEALVRCRGRGLTNA